MPASKAQSAATSARRAQAIKLRIAGVDYDTIATTLGYASRGAAHTDIDRALQANKAEEDAAKEILREIEALRLDRLQAAVWNDAVKGDPQAIGSALKIIAQRCRLLGLDAPTRTRIEIVDEEVARLLVDQLEADFARLTADLDEAPGT